ncbi:uncharacterized protein LOC141910566 [Tubulanus polymorphus]|uniref:uncharacterized protein LOC141910566 n=1 Tax=Tubulanus polymorphus TaxID=672921 RepID=UPI003DA57347
MATRGAMHVVFPSDVEAWPGIRDALLRLKTIDDDDIDEFVKSLEIIHKLVHGTSFPPERENMILRKCVFYGVKRFFDKEASAEERRRFFEETLPFVVDAAVDIENRKPPNGLQYSLQSEPGDVELSRSFILSVIACAFLCLFPRRPKEIEASLNDINFNNFFHYLPSTPQSGKLRCILHYFERVSKMETELSGKVTFSRQVLPDSEKLTLKLLSDSVRPLCPLYVDKHGKIEDSGSHTVQVDFANSYIGGGVLHVGRVQEEIRFCLSPELIASMLFMTCMEKNEAIVIRGFEQFSEYSGYCDCLRFAGDKIDENQRDEEGNIHSCLCAIDAIPYMWGNKYAQYSGSNVLREINKAYVGFSSTAAVATPRDETDCLRKRKRLRDRLSESSEEFYSAPESLDDEGGPDTAESSQGKVRPPIFSSNIPSSPVRLHFNTSPVFHTSEVVPSSEKQQQQQHPTAAACSAYPSLLDIETMRLENARRRGSNLSDCGASTTSGGGSSRRSSSRPSCEFSDFESWASSFRRRSSNLSDLSSSRRSSSSTRYSSDFSSEFEEYYESFQRQEHRKIQHESIVEESAVPFVVDYAGNLVANAPEESASSVEASGGSGMAVFDAKQPQIANITRPKAVRVTSRHVGQAPFLPPLTDTQKYYGRDDTDSSSENSPTHSSADRRRRHRLRVASESERSTLTGESPYFYTSIDYHQRFIPSSEFIPSRRSSSRSEPMDSAFKHGSTISDINITDDGRFHSDDHDSDIDLNTPQNVHDAFADQIAKSMITDAVGNIMSFTRQQQQPQRSSSSDSSSEALSIANRIVSKLFDDLQEEFRQSIPDSMKLEEKAVVCGSNSQPTIAPKIVISQHVTPAATASLDTFVDDFVAQALCESAAELGNAENSSSSDVATRLNVNLTSRYSKMVNESVSYEEIYRYEGERRSFTRKDEDAYESVNIDRYFDHLVGKALGDVYKSLGYRKTTGVQGYADSSSSTGSSSAASSSGGSQCCKYLDVHWMSMSPSTNSSSASLTSYARRKAARKHRRERIKSNSFSSYGEFENAMDDQKSMRRNSAGTFVDPLLSRFAEELQRSDPNSPSLELYGDGSVCSTSRRGSRDYDKRDAGAVPFEVELCRTPDLDIDPVALFPPLGTDSELEPSLFLSGNANDATEKSRHRRCRRHRRATLKAFYKYAKQLSKTVIKDAIKTVTSRTKTTNRFTDALRVFGGDLVDEAFHEALNDVRVRGGRYRNDDVIATRFTNMEEFARRLCDDVLHDACFVITGSYFPTSSPPSAVRLMQIDIADVERLKSSDEYVSVDNIFQAWPIATGNWGCGAFGGDPQLKAIIQWIAASYASSSAMIYYTFQDPRVEKFPDVVNFVRGNKLTVKWIVGRVQEYCRVALDEHEQRDEITTQLFDFLLNSDDSQ